MRAVLTAITRGPHLIAEIEGALIVEPLRFIPVGAPPVRALVDEAASAPRHAQTVPDSARDVREQYQRVEHVPELLSDAAARHRAATVTNVSASDRRPA